MRGLLNHRLFPALAISAVVVLLPLVFPSAYYYRVAALVFVFALAAVGLNLLMGFAGQVSLGHAGFMGIGAYAVAIGPTHLSLPSWLSFVGGAGLSALVAFAVGRPILRLKGHYLAVATLGFGPSPSATKRASPAGLTAWRSRGSPCSVSPCEEHKPGIGSQRQASWSAPCSRST
jgi:branched-chain amino acid transport system permease protein